MSRRAMWDKLEDTEKRYEELTREMGRPDVAADFQRLQALAKDRASLEDIVELYRRYKQVDAALAEARSPPGARRRRCLPPTYSACTTATPSATPGPSRSSPVIPATWAALRRSSVRCAARAPTRASSTRAASTASR